MKKNSIKFLLMMTLLAGLLMTISSTSWLGAWMGLEVNLLSFIPLMSNNDNIFMTEASLKYFLIQVLASSSFLFIILSKSLIESMFTFSSNPLTSFMTIFPLLMKSGVPPLHWWFPSVMEGLNWMNCFILMTIQKIAPFLLISYVINMNFFLIFTILISVIIGSIGGYNQTSVRKILAYSSINHMGWMLASMMMSEELWMLYFVIYLILTLTIISITSLNQFSLINQTFFNNKNSISKFLLLSSLLSMGGLPPFLGFLPKWMSIQLMLTNEIITLPLIMVVVSLVTIYYYLRISYSSFILLSLKINWNHKFYENETLLWFPTFMTSISMLGLILMMFFLNLV